MHTILDGHDLEIQDTGAPRGERNYWFVNLNKVQIYAGYSRRHAEEKYEQLKEALESKGK